jgi:hypothetical protein
MVEQIKMVDFEFLPVFTNGNSVAKETIQITRLWKCSSDFDLKNEKGFFEIIQNGGDRVFFTFSFISSVVFMLMRDPILESFFNRLSKSTCFQNGDRQFSSSSFTAIFNRF